MFLGQDYLIANETGKRIFASVKDLPILDPHNHADVAAIARNEKFKDAWELFAATDHYVWEILRKTGVPEEKITGKASPHDKFIAMAKVFDQIAGNPVYEWIHLDLRFLGVEELLSAETGELIWKKVNEILAKEESRPQALLKRMNVGVMCSTDDPADTLEYHKVVNESVGRTIVRPTWRPDAAMKAGKP
ncbi:MAG: glucuronate isomerase, partial [Lentisphaeria bacterium]|nr:glucuronate isomerase [Lentisphaeria bacterium]